MKVYILNYKINDLNSIFPKLLKLKLKSTMIEGIEIYSVDGIIFIDNSNTYKLTYIDGKIQHINNYYNNYNLAIDYSTIKKENITQITPEHLAFNVKIYTFKKSDNSKIKLVIKCESNTNSEANKKDIVKDKKLVNETISDFYFEIPDGIELNDILFKEELNEFLSMLN